MKLINADEYKKDIEHYRNTICYQRNVTMDDCMRILDKQKDVFDKMSDDVISRQAVLEKAINIPIAKVVTEDEVICRKVVFVDDIENLPPVIPGHCKDCKYFEYDYAANVDGIPLILAHEFCKRWGDGCKTREDGYCFLYEPRESEALEYGSN